MQIGLQKEGTTLMKVSVAKNVWALRHGKWVHKVATSVIQAVKLNICANWASKGGDQPLMKVSVANMFGLLGAAHGSTK